MLRPPTRTVTKAEGGRRLNHKSKRSRFIINPWIQSGDLLENRLLIQRVFIKNSRGMC